MNESQRNDPRFWEKWRKSGAVSGVESSKLKNMLTLLVTAVASHFAGSRAGTQTLSLGEEVIGQGVDSQGKPWQVTRPKIYREVFGHNVKPGDTVEV